jgi:ABC-type Mn2+/Zn2+ transport system permease subunit
VVNSVVAGVLAALVAGRFTNALWLSVAIGAVAFLLVGFAHERHHVRTWWGTHREGSASAAES